MEYYLGDQILINKEYKIFDVIDIFETARVAMTKAVVYVSYVRGLSK